MMAESNEPPSRPSSGVDVGIDWPPDCCHGEEDVIELWKNATPRISSINTNRNNPIFARGAFGEISLALFFQKDTDDDIDDKTGTLRFVAIKTIAIATIKTTTQTISCVEDGGASGGESATTSTRQLSLAVRNELQALQTLQSHPNIVELLAVYPAAASTSSSSEYYGTTCSSSLSLAFEYCPVDLHMALEWRKQTDRPLLSMPVIQTIASDLFAALDHCHNNNNAHCTILHRDIKPGNILISSAGIVKLCDFGLAAQHQSGSTPTTESAALGQRRRREADGGLCTLFYRSPEVLMGAEACHPSVDVFSAGLVLAEMLLGRVLFMGINDLDQLHQIFSQCGTPSDTLWPAAKILPYGELNFVPHPPRALSEYIPRCDESRHLGDFLQQCLELDPSLRISTREAICHPWLQNGMVQNRSILLNDLVPKELDAPFFLSPSDAGAQASTKEALSLVSTRKSFLKKLNDWKIDAKISN